METEEKPTTAFVLSFIGAIFILIGGAIVAVAGAIVAVLFPGVGLALAGAAIVCGLLTLIGAIMLYVNPNQRQTWGIIVIVFSILSLFFCLGGFIVGLILGIIGGALAISWKPTKEVPSQVKRICPSCGRVIEEDIKFCPHCGKELQ